MGPIILAGNQRPRRRPPNGENGPMRWEGTSYLWGPIVASGVIGLLILVLRWAFSGNNDSLLAKRTRMGSDSEYGLLVVVARPGTAAAGETMRALLEREGIRGTLTTTTNGLRLMVFPEQAARAREILAEPPS